MGEFSGYTGVYSERGIGTSIGTSVTGTSDRGIVIDDNSPKRQFTISTKALKDSKLNVAKLRLVSTVPNKEVDDEVKGKAFVGFILSSVQESHSEKLEIVPLPGDTYASYFYGGNPRQFTFSGTLLNTDQDRWRDSFELMYEKYLRGSASSRNFNIVQVSYDNRVVSGWLTNLSQQLEGSNDRFSMFSFTLLVSRIDMLGGNQQFKDYLLDVDEDGPFSGANIDPDYAVLDPSNLNAMIDPIRTGMVIPPKRPHRAPGKRKGKQVNCWFEAPTTDAGKPTNTGSQVGNSHINDSYTCTVIEQVVGTTEKIESLLTEADELLKKDDLQGAKAKRVQAQRMADELKSSMATDATKEQLNDEAKSLVTRARSNRDRLTESQKSDLDRGIIRVKGATVTIFEGNSSGGSATSTAVAFDPEYTRNNGGSGGVGTTASTAIATSRQTYLAAERRLEAEAEAKRKEQEDKISTQGTDRLLNLKVSPRRR